MSFRVLRILVRGFRATLRPGHFECQRCGACCAAYNVCVTDSDVKRITSSYELQPHNFLEGILVPEKVAYTYSGVPKFIGDKGREMVLVLKEERGRCIFNKGECEIYPVRPLNCRAFPFLWVGGRKFKLNSDALFLCDGIGRGGKFDFETVFKEMLLLEEEWKKYRFLVERWNNFVKNGVVVPSTRKFIDFLFGG